MSMKKRSFFSNLAVVLLLSFPLPLLAQPYAYVADSAAGSVTAMDTSNNTVAATMTGFSTPVAVAVSPDGSHAYVAEKGAGDVAVIDTSSFSVSGRIAVGGQPVALALGPQGNTLYVADAANGQVEVVDTATGNTTSTLDANGTPTALALSPSGERLAIAESTNQTVEIYDFRKQQAGVSAAHQSVAVAAVPSAMVFGRENVHVYGAVAGGFEDVDADSGTANLDAVTGTFVSIAVSPRRSVVYLGASGSATVQAYDLGTGSATAISVNGSPVTGLAVSPDGTRVYAVQGCSACGVAVINASTNQMSTDVAFGQSLQTRGRFVGPGAIHGQDQTFQGSVGAQLTGHLSVTDDNGRTLTYATVSSAAAGTTNLSGTGDFTYTPPSGFSGVESFVFDAQAQSGSGSPNQPASRPLTATLEIQPTVSAIADQSGAAGSLIGPLTFSVAGTEPLQVTATSSDQSVVSAGNIVIGAGCGTSSLDCTLKIPVSSQASANSSTVITLTATDPQGLQGQVQFRVSATGSAGGGGGGGAFGVAGLIGLGVLLGALGIRRRRHSRPDTT